MELAEAESALAESVVAELAEVASAVVESAPAVEPAPEAAHPIPRNNSRVSRRVLPKHNKARLSARRRTLLLIPVEIFALKR